MNLQDLEILEDDFDLFVALNDRQKVEFLFDALETGIEASILKQIEKLSDRVHEKQPKISSSNMLIGNNRLEVTVTKNELHLNSDSLQCIKQFVFKLVNDGLILQRLNIKKSIFDMYKYFKAYKIIARGQPFSSN